MIQRNVKMAGGFKVKGAVTLPVLKLAASVQRFVYFDGPMHVGKDTGQVMNGKKMEPATVANVTDMETGEQGVLICATVMAGELRNAYPDDSYVGKGFALTLIKVPEKKYNMYEILEIDLDETGSESTVKKDEDTGAVTTTKPAANAKPVANKGGKK